MCSAKLSIRTPESADQVEMKYCYRCQASHPISEMCCVVDKTGRARWRCKKTLRGAKSPQAVRDNFGKSVSLINKEDSRARALRRLGSERKKE